LIGYQALAVWQDWELMRLLEYTPVYVLLGGIFLARHAKHLWKAAQPREKT
jgi:hypothetical protein